MITSKQKEFVCYYLSCRSIENACKECGINRRTFYNWLKKEDFRQYLNEKEKEVIDEAIFKIKISLNSAVDVLLRCLESDDEKVRKSTSKDILDYFLKVKEITEIEKRIKVIEEKVMQMRVGK